ncbi:MAG: hypothetical protein DGJ47_001097 [Rickettsiaceae bacterium]
MNKSRTILFIDDVKVCHTVVEMIFMGLDSYNLINVYSGSEALKILSDKHQDIDVIISDVTMNDFSGYELFEKLQNHEDYRTIPFILQSGFVDKTNTLSRHDGTRVPIIYKPYQRQELLEVIESVLP